MRHTMLLGGGWVLLAPLSAAWGMVAGIGVEILVLANGLRRICYS